MDRLLWVAVAVVAVLISATLLRKMGYSGWWALLVPVPVVGLILWIIVAAKQWPIERQLARLRLIANESDDIDADVESVLAYAIVHENHCRWDAAASMYALVAEKTTKPKIKEYAMECARRLAENLQS